MAASKGRVLGHFLLHYTRGCFSTVKDCVLLTVAADAQHVCNVGIVGELADIGLVYVVANHSCSARARAWTLH